MAESSTPSRRPSGATVALALAGLLAITAAGIAISRPDEAAAPADPHSNLAAGETAGTPEQMIAGLRERLRQDPDNHEGWFLIGLAYRGSGRFAEAEQAFRRASELAPQNVDYAAYLGEALLLRGGDSPSPEAERLFRRVLELEPGNPQARYYLATLKDLGGDHRGAIDDLIVLLRDAPPDAPWEPQVREAVTAIAGEHGVDIAGRLPPPRPASTSTATAAIPGPSRQDLEAAKGIPPSEQSAMAQRMVEGLADRLRQNPRDERGWIMLMRSRMVLNDPAAAQAALRSGLAAFQGDSAAQARLRTAARELAVPEAS